MKKKIQSLLTLGIMLLSIHEGFSQDMTVNFKTNCVETNNCNPFLGGFACQAAILQTTHGSPTFYLPSSDRQIEMLSEVSSNGTQYGEGFTIKYDFQPNKTYTVKIQHKALPQGGTLAPKLIAALLVNPPHQNDECELGNLASTDVYSSNEFTVSQAVQTSSFTITPTKAIPYLWLRTMPSVNARAGLVLLSLMIIRIILIHLPIPDIIVVAHRSIVNRATILEAVGISVILYRSI